jgi:hypothetical protein
MGLYEIPPKGSRARRVWNITFWTMGAVFAVLLPTLWFLHLIALGELVVLAYPIACTVANMIVRHRVRD